ncbi:outer membrane beta-barrel protein [Pontibacter sp. MBLB2868]|uniref:outer membrane beta-barrel protein n=1 Tax=Pontibacter sp. MBLB2868 TaxID=3451555 RepID=UPI003F74D540
MRHALTLLLVWFFCHTSTSSSLALAIPEELFHTSCLCKVKDNHPNADTIIQRIEVSPSKIRFGIKLGVGSSRTNFNFGYPKPATRIDLVWKPSLSAGMLLEIHIYKKISLQQEYLYTFVGGEVKEDGISYSLGYLSLPVVLQYEVTPKTAVIIGSHLDLLVHASERFNEISTDISHHIEERNISAAVGVRYKLSHNFSLESKYLQSLNHIGIKKDLIEKEFKLELLQLSLIIFPF